MKLFHLSDLHLGKRVNEFSMIDDQRYILDKILSAADDYHPEGIIIAGDVYDKSIPSTEAVELFDDFLCRVAARNIPAYIISGNHDSAERLAFASKLIKSTGIHISPVYDGNVQIITAEDKFGPVNICLLPFLKPSHVKRYFPETEINSYTDAIRTALSSAEINKTERNILITHQFVTGASRTESEDISVGGADNVDASVFADFDYVALGHIHRSQSAGGEYIRYSGTPLKYSFSESKDEKSITVVNILEKGNVELEFIPLIPKRDLIEIKGKYNELMDRSFYEKLDKEAYYRITLTDEDDIPDAVAKLRIVYKNIMRLDFDNSRTRTELTINNDSDPEKTDPLTLFAELFEKQFGREMSEAQRTAAEKLIEKLWEDR